MPATDSELASMEDPHPMEHEEGSSSDIPSSVPPPPVVPSSTPLDPTTMRANVPSETTIEEKAVYMASNDFSSALSSPAEASPAKPTATSPTTFEGTVKTSPATSHIASASDSLTCTETSNVPASQSPPLPFSVSSSNTFGSTDPEQVFPTLLTFKGVSVTLENNSVWKQFNSCGTEMILTKQGRRMFPYCRYRLSGLDPDQRYSLVLSIAPSDQYRYRWNSFKWEASGPAEHQSQTMIRAFAHHYSPSLGSEWMGSLVSFYKLKLTNCSHDQEGHIILHSMHRYIPRLHVIPLPDGNAPSPDQPVVMGPESMTFTFPQTEFMAVTTYQNFRITQLKINHNPFAKGFREEGNNPRLNRITTDAQHVIKMNTHLVNTEAQPVEKTDTHLVNTEAQPVEKTDTHLVNTEAQLVEKKDTHLVNTEAQPVEKKDTHLVNTETQPVEKKDTPLLSTVAQPLEDMDTHLVTTEASPVVKMEPQPILKPAAGLNENKEEVVNLSSKDPTVSNEHMFTRLVLKPIMSYPSKKDLAYVPCIRGKHALGELVLFQQRRLVKPKEETLAVDISPKMHQLKPRPMAMTPTSLTPSPSSSTGDRKRKKRMNKRWANSRGREWKAVAAPPTVLLSPSLTVAMQPELDDVEGLLFVSFTSKEALDVHIRDMPGNSTPSASPVSLTTPMQWEEKVEVILETDEEQISRSEAILLRDLAILKHRQVIHPVLQEVGMKLSSLDTMRSIDLQYLGVRLPLPPPNLKDQGNATALSQGEEGLSFISRTGKTSDVTKIKGWRNKFIRSKDTSPPKCEGPKKNLSAFCSNMLDEYLESEAQYISERSAAFTTNSDSVAYQLPVKSSSYVKTLDSVLKHQRHASKLPVGANRPCPLSRKPLLYSALAAPPPPLGKPATPVPSVSPSIQPSASSPTPPAGPRFPTHQTGVSQKAAVSFLQSHMMHKPIFTKFQLKLWHMELDAQNQGLSRTQLTPDRLSVALSVILSKQMQSKQMVKVHHCPNIQSVGPECGKEFCTLGCVCSSLERLNRGPFHCRRTDCMLGCTCFKRKITKHLAEGEREELIQPVYSVTNIEHVVQPRPGSHSKKLWNYNIHSEDPDPIFTPKCAPPGLSPVKFLKRGVVSRTNQPIREEDKDPVYKYLESMMTCARVRAFNSKPPPVLSLEPMLIDTSTANPAAKPQENTTDDQPTNCLKNLPSVEKEVEKASQKIASNESEAKKQIEVSSACKWTKDRKMVLKALFRRMNQNRLSQRFWVGPYHIRPVAKIFIRKPSGSIFTYRVHISKPSKVSDVEEDEHASSEEDEHEGSIDEEENDGQNEESEVQYGVTPFLSGVLPAGRLRAKTKPVGCQASGLIQVNGKSYNQARLLLGNMGSLHPANRLAAFVTGRLPPPGGTSLKNSQKSNPTTKSNTPGALHIKAAGTVVPPIITARKTTDLKTAAQPPAQEFPPCFWKKGFVNMPQYAHSIPFTTPFITGARGSIKPFKNTSSSSPVSLTVSPSLKTPSFLGESGTYSFRICPPDNQSTSGPNLPGVELPGGFTLIQLPKPSSESENTTNSGVNKALSQKEILLNLIKGRGSHAPLSCLDAVTGSRDLLRSKLVEPEPPYEVHAPLMVEKDGAEKIPKEEREESNISQVDNASEDSDSSDTSDYCGEDDAEVDIETVEEAGQGKAIAEMKKAVRKALKESGGFNFFSTFRDSMNHFGLTGKPPAQDKADEEEEDESKDKKRRTNHTVLERQRRCEQRVLFDKLSAIMKCDPRVPRLRLLSMAQQEINHLVEESRSLQEKKMMLSRMQSLYIKELSVLSGKPDMLIKQKLNEICERQKIRDKMKELPYFSNLLQSKAVDLRTSALNAELQPRRRAHPDFQKLLSQTNLPSQANPLQIAAHRKIMSLLKPDLQSTPAQPSELKVIPQQVHSLPAAPQKSEDPLQVLESLAQVCNTNLKSESEPKSTHVPTFRPKEKPAEPPKPIALPLIRSKTGRIILPSSLKPLGHGFYTLTVMQPRQKGEEDGVSPSADVHPPKVESSENQDKSMSDHELFIDVENCCDFEDDQAAQPSNSKPKSSGPTPAPVELTLLKSVSVPSGTPQAVEKSQEGGPAERVDKTLPTACLSFQPVNIIPSPVIPPVVRRGRGRPRKNSLPPCGAFLQNGLLEDAGVNLSKSETSTGVEETLSEKRTVASSEMQADDSPGVVSDNPLLVKRGRGRPPKKKTIQLWSPPGVKAGSSPSSSNQHSPVRQTYCFKSPEESPATTTRHGEVSDYRPLTRGSLGKDFPSAKKRSWIDVEKELEPELESE
ncbi:MAX gene-associated protein isoform X1 [Gymnodraco acuticeps]|uniref:MAX gene-associated protein isoform X1 n=1 Tax=Gymnodraco acuticeps TaxID=8218 RepID=A0A6P8VDF0_GYMAC|nr:MAX gene-associated protein isoform X1 [Gymnodraco acuticeps]XP_034084534.1 MAX gene-associated protein isoform X1 [Gymnodraco acuticeps]XP_034084535.1 MAX gene-associated protein isoform X1 [Gymnodraco acuticeps]